MAELFLRLAHDPTVLLSAAADGFLAPPAGAGPFPTPSYLLALRQGGVRDDLLSLAARRGVPGWFDPPLCTFQELPELIGAGPLRPLDPFERVALLGALVRRVDGQVLARLRRPEAYLAALDRLFGEVAAEGVRPEALAAAQGRCDERDAFAIRRDEEVAAVYAEYVRELDLVGRRDGRDSLVACAAAVRSDPEALSRRLGGRREIRILGLQDLRGGWRALLAALVESPALDAVAVYSSVELGLRHLGARPDWLPEPDGIAARLFGSSRAIARLVPTILRPPMPVYGTGRAGQRRTTNAHLQGDLFAPVVAASERTPDAENAQPAGPAADADGSASERSSVQVLVAPDAQREVEEIAARVRALVDGGVPPHRIAVVAREARPQLPMAAAALGRFGLPVTARMRTGLAEVPVVRGVLALLDVAAEGWTRHGLVELADQPYLGVELDAGVLNTVGFRTRVAGLDEWDAALVSLLAEAEERERKEAAGEAEQNGHPRPVPPTWRVKRTLEQLRSVRERIAELDRPRRLKEWLGWLRDMLEQDRWGIEDRVYRAPGDRAEVIRLDLAGLKALNAIAERWCEALESWGGSEEPLDVGTFAARLRDELDADVALWTQTRAGVQVLEGLAAAYRSFDHVFVVGLEAGRFPRPAGRSPLLDAVERDALSAAGLPVDGRVAWESRERELFRSIVAAGQSLTVSYARLDAAGREVAPSAFVEALEDVAVLERSEIDVARVLTPALPLCPPERLPDAERVARMERQRQAGIGCAANGLIEDPTLVEWLSDHFGEERVWSPTQLETFAKCPWSYFGGRILRLEKREDPDTEMDPSVRGTILHDTLRRFFDAAVERRGGAVMLTEEDLGWAEPALLAALDEAIAAAGDESWLGHTALRGARREELRRLIVRYLAWEIARNEKSLGDRSKTLRTAVMEHEKAIDDIVLERNGVRFRFRGRIDRVEIGIDDRVDGDANRYVAAVDYKTTAASTPGAGSKDAWADGVVLQVPLYAHALSELWHGAEVARVEYRALKSPRTVHGLELVQVDPKLGGAVACDDDAERLDAALDTAARHVAAVRAGHFPIRPAPSCGCPPWCAGRDICRVPGGPREKSR